MDSREQGAAEKKVCGMTCSSMYLLGSKFLQVNHLTLQSSLLLELLTEEERNTGQCFNTRVPH